jgi:hypothetical protein
LNLRASGGWSGCRVLQVVQEDLHHLPADR